MKPQVTLSQEFAHTHPTLVRAGGMADFPKLELVVFHSQLGAKLGIEPEQLLELLHGSGHAMAYAGHQFGQFVPVLGDGRALLLGELATTNGLVDIHVKGTGRTVFSRGGDGFCPLPAAMKEYLFSIALAGLGIATSEVLAVFRTGAMVQRSGPVPGALVVRVARSHIRVGTFQFAALQGGDTVRQLADYVITRHYPGLDYAELLTAIVQQQALTVSQWMRLGFLHGVLNTDNTTITGESLDFGPCAWAERFDPALVYSSIDTAGRYRFGYQPGIIGWNLARLAETFIPLVGLETAQTAINSYSEFYRQAWLTEAGLGLGFTEVTPETTEVIADFYDLLESSQADTVSLLRTLTEEVDAQPDSCLTNNPQWRVWRERYVSLTPDRSIMRTMNPVYVPRNHLVAKAMTDLSFFKELAPLLAAPFSRNSSAPAIFETPSSPEFLTGFRTFCGT